MLGIILDQDIKLHLRQVIIWPLERKELVMSRLPHADRTRMNLLPVLVCVLAFLLIVAAPAFAQLTEADIEALRERGKQEGWTFEVALNETNSKYSLEQLCGFKKPANWYDMAPHTVFTTAVELPSRWDWRERGGVSPIKDQRSCGSCWAFSTVGALECAIKIRDGITVDLSEQWLVSCNTSGWDCIGGFFAHDYHELRNDVCGQSGAVMEGYFPYVASDAPCDGCPYPHDYWIDGWAYIGTSRKVPPSEDIKQAIMEYGPVSVGCYANSAWSGYSGGVFNACEDLPTNHSVVIVGWDDDYLGQSVWIVKNSWGTFWGEDGFMYIPYDCSFMGEGACYVEIGLVGLFFWADSTVGWTPHEVSFDATTGLDVDTWTWDFGDGDSAFVKTPPPHIYTDNGTYDVTLQIDAGGDIRTVTKELFIVAIADTVRGDTITMAPDTHIEMVINANNSAPIQYLKIPAEFSNDFGMLFDSFSTAGCRTEYFETQIYLHYDPFWGKRITLKLVSSINGSSPDLEPGEGPVAKLYFTIPASAMIGQSTTIELDGYDSYTPSYYGDVASYDIGSVNGHVIVFSETCCMVAGDADHGGDCNLVDANYLIDWLYRGGPEYPCKEEADFDRSDNVDIQDIEALLSYLFRGGSAPEPCP